MTNQKENEVTILPLGDWIKRAHPLLMFFKGGHRAKAGEWFLEIQRVLYDIYKSFVLLENFLSRANKDVFVGEQKTKVDISDQEKLWFYGYIVDNAYLRIGSCLDKIAQIVRVYYEHPDHGGELLVYPRCGKCDPEPMTENSCSFGTLLNTLRRNGRDPEIDNALFALETSDVLSKIKKTRNDIAHRTNKNIFYPGLDPNIKVEIDQNTGVQKTTFKLGSKPPSLNDYRILISDAHNELVKQINIIGPKVFPEK